MNSELRYGERDLPIERSEPLTGSISAEEAELAVAGLLILPTEPCNPNVLLKFGPPARLKSTKNIGDLISEDRDAV